MGKARNQDMNKAINDRLFCKMLSDLKALPTLRGPELIAKYTTTTELQPFPIQGQHFEHCSLPEISETPHSNNRNPKEHSSVKIDGTQWAQSHAITPGAA